MRHYCWYGGRGGSGGYLNYLTGILRSGVIPEDCTVSLLCSQALADHLGPLDPQVRVIPVPALANPIQARWWLRFQFADAVRALQPDVLFFASGSIAPPPAGIPTVAPCHSLLFFDDVEYDKYRHTWMEWKYLRPMRRLHLALYPTLAGLIFFTPYSRELVQRSLPSLPPSAIIPHGVEPAFLAKTPVPSIANPPTRLLYVSTVNLYKHQWQVIRAVKQLRQTTGIDYQLTLIGGADATAKKQLQRCLQAEEAQAFTTWQGAVDHRELPRYYREADLFVYASSCESFGITLLEAMGSGLPVACARRSGLPDLLGDAGEYFDPEEPAEIAAAITRFATDPSHREACARRALASVRAYTWRRCAEDTFAFLAKVAAQPPAGRLP